jgi:uncharacterized protein (DUF433 family)
MVTRNRKSAWQEWLRISPQVRYGAVTVGETRISADDVLELIHAGLSAEDVVAEWRHSFPIEAVNAVMAWAEAGRPAIISAPEPIAV